MKILTEISRETYGHDGRAINKHSERKYRDTEGSLYVLSKTLDGCPPFFEAYGPYRPEHKGVLPRLRVGGKEYPPSLGSYGGLRWGDDWTWQKAVKAFCRELCVTIQENS